MNKVMGLFIGGTEVVACVVLIWGSTRMRVVFHAVRNAKGKVSQAVSNVVGGVSETYYLNHGNYASKTSKVTFDNFMQQQIKANVWDASYYSITLHLKMLKIHVSQNYNSQIFP